MMCPLVANVFIRYLKRLVQKGCTFSCAEHYSVRVSLCISNKTSVTRVFTQNLTNVSRTDDVVSLEHRDQRHQPRSEA